MSFRSKISRGMGASAIAIAVSAAFAPGIAMAQDQAADASGKPSDQASTDADGTIIVTGFREAIASSLRNKRDTLGVIDSVTAEDVGKLPDISIVDSISRLPGVTVQTQQGRGQMISIRGFSGDFTGAKGRILVRRSRASS